MSELLRRVSSLARRRRKTASEYRAAISEAAREHSQQAIAEAAGVTQQAVSDMLRHLPREENEQ